MRMQNALLLNDARFSLMKIFFASARVAAEAFDKISDTLMFSKLVLLL